MDIFSSFPVRLIKAHLAQIDIANPVISASEKVIFNSSSIAGPTAMLMQVQEQLGEQSGQNNSALYMGPVEAAVATLVWSIILLTASIGNIMVIVAIFTHPALYIVQNFLLVSLALADILVALLVMPFSITTTLLGQWIFGREFCLFHVTCDVLLCTASILHLVAIALDRFFAIHCPIRYAQTRNLTLVLVMIAAAWIISALISIPPLVGWNDMAEDPNQCGYVSEKGYIIYSALGSFYIPLIILVTVYLTIFISARRRLRRRAGGASPYSVTSAVSTPQGQVDTASVDSPDKSDTGTTLLNSAHPLSQSLSAKQLRHSTESEHRRLHRKLFIFPTQKRCSACRRAHSKFVKETSLTTSSFQIIQEDDFSTASPIVDLTVTHDLPARLESVHVNGTAHMHPPPPSVSKSQSLLFVPNASRPKQLANKSKSSPKREQLNSPTKPTTATGLHQSVDVKQSLAKRQKISLTKERRAARTLLIVVLVFVICWLPFFVWYVIKPFCPSCPMDERWFNVMLWLGFLNSSLNPVIYTIFNLDFRKAFKRIFRRLFPAQKCLNST